MSKGLRVVAAVFLWASLVSCARNDATPPPPATELKSESLTGEEWVVEDIAGGGVVDNSRVTMKFGEDGRVAGRGSCNSYSAPYSLTPETLTIGQAVATRMACAPALMDQESKFFDVLAKVETFEIDETGALVLKASDGRTILARR